MRPEQHLAPGLAEEQVIENFSEHALLARQEQTCSLIRAQSELMAAVEALVMGRCVQIKERHPLPEATASPISLFVPYNTTAYRPTDEARAGQRTYLGCKPNYAYLESSIRRHKKVVGRVVSVNSGRNSLVIKPRWARVSGEHCWVRMVDGDGQPLVNLSIR